jgi:Protein of unknown function (DUF1360)
MTSTDLPGGAGEDYAHADEHRPLGGYAALTGAFAAALGAAAAELRRSGRELPERLAAQDLLLAGVATHKISRLVAKDKVTSFLRAPFTEFQEKSGHGELEERARGRGLRHATGELLVCPYCLAQWVSAGFALGYVRAPRTTRLVAGMFTIYAISDALQLAYAAAEEAA